MLVGPSIQPVPTCITGPPPLDDGAVEPRVAVVLGLRRFGLRADDRVKM
jgi:hypothetical protein